MRAGLSETALLPGNQNDVPDPSTNGYVEAASAEQVASLSAEVEPDSDVTDRSISWERAGGGLYSEVEDMPTWPATGLAVGAGNAVVAV